jgi:hypothetical protein
MKDGLEKDLNRTDHDLIEVLFQNLHLGTEEITKHLKIAHI